MANPNGPIPDSDVVKEAIRGTAEDGVSLIAMFTTTSFDLFYVGESYRDSFADGEELRERMGRLAQDARSEFVEHDLFAGMQPVHDRVEYRTRPSGDRKCLQIFCGGVGMLLIVDPDEPEEPLVESAARLLGNQL
jgi:hypothetical protein